MRIIGEMPLKTKRISITIKKRKNNVGTEIFIGQQPDGWGDCGGCCGSHAGEINRCKSRIFCGEASGEIFVRSLVF